MGVLTKIKKKSIKNKKQEKKESCFLKIVHPHGYIELFRQPITAGEIMKRYPRHCVARTDFFEYPWIVVRPQSILVPGEMFFLVSHKTVDRTLKEKKRQNLELSHDQSYYVSLINHDHDCNGASSSNGGAVHGSDNGGLYRPSFYESWNEMQRRFDEGNYIDVESPRRRVESTELDELQRVRSCMRRPDSDRRNLDLNVTFASPVVVVLLDDQNFYAWTHDH